ncbi:FAD-binding protein [Salinibacterium sp. dk2585]|uniref:FAD-dependent monooxygenase n=1 Tax=unclassified Salinibacterium TaxID=2632331 RepID=UPI0011C247AF|nr:MULTISPECIES: FAD-dependent monooxygenase [unclassified Salinibacterium]QEE60394.1 FAD-binding protein [Salinibacterium sp. dk2585]TXK55467.1 FAD-binding protein [Salinibacterium sp. dk5596]
MSEQPTEVDVLVSGAGIAGLATALGLARGGRKVHVLERAPELGEVGAGIQLAPNALSALDSLGVLDKVLKDAVFPERKVYLDAVTGKTIGIIDLGEEFVKHYGYPYVVAHRADLHSSLLEGCRESGIVEVETDREVVSAVNQPDGKVLVTTLKGQSYLANAVIGADGIRSPLRDAIIGDELVPTKYVAYRGTVPTEIVGEDITSSPSVLCWLGPNMHLIQYPLRSGKVYNNVAVFKSDSYSPDHDNWGTPEELDARFSVCCESVQNAGKYLSRDIRWPMYDREPTENWVDGNVALIGDAAHAMVQYLAQGGAQSLDDSIAMAGALLSSENTSDAFAEYQERRVVHANNIQRLARVAGELFHIEGIGREIRNYAFKDHDPKDFSNLDWMFMPLDKAPKVRNYPA